ncbi:hypothetical protein C2G38_2032488 [Gigaspora rosea]|uniref:Uncharacterized protein n=1 Tax=Gigaspora rosea TaxID=44941 RepID=A0A397VPB0_9GLOM|nr:hypothetical protein C2G38_2032488 [Gigaspora rosea]
MTWSNPRIKDVKNVSVKKVTPGNLCCPTDQTIYICGLKNTLMNKSGNDLRDILAPILDGKNIHVLKKLKFNYSHLHFETKNDAEQFYAKVNDQTFMIEHEKSGKIEVYTGNNNSDDSNFGEGMSYSMNVSNSAEAKN